jgi:hypothetical protein
MSYFCHKDVINSPYLCHILVILEQKNPLICPRKTKDDGGGERGKKIRGDEGLLFFSLLRVLKGICPWEVVL